MLNDLAPYLNVTRLNENIYYLNAEGRERVGATKVLKKTNQLEHHLMRNALYLAHGCPSSWRSEVKLTVKGEVSIVADAVFSVAGRYYICEVDNTQKMRENSGKVAKYRRMVELCVFDKPPKFVWLTATDYRKKQLAKLCEGLDAIIYTRGDFDV